MQTGEYEYSNILSEKSGKGAGQPPPDSGHIPWKINFLISKGSRSKIKLHSLADM